MLFNKLKAAMTIVLFLSFMTTGVTFLASGTAAEQNGTKPTEKPAEKGKPKDEPPPAPDKKNVLTPEDVVRQKMDMNKATVEFKVEYVSKSILVKMAGGEDAAWDIGHGPDDLRLRPKAPQEKKTAVFEAILTDHAIKQLKRAGITDVAKHLKSKTVRVTGKILWAHYSGYGTPPVAEVVINDLSQFEVVD